MPRLGTLFVCLLLLIGCDTGDRISRLEKQTADLKAQVSKDSAVEDFDLQAKCSKDAREWFNENWSRDKDTILLDFTDHYNAKLNKCFILVEYHYNSHLAGPGGESWTNNVDLTDVYENSTYAHFTENHYTYVKPPKISTEDEVISCEVSGNTCKTGTDFNNFVAPYMHD